MSGYRLLQQILFPDGVTSVSYGYDAQGNLASVSRPPNSASANRPVQYFGYLPFGNGLVLQWAASPRWCAGVCGADGAFTAFGYGGGTVPTATVAAIWPGRGLTQSFPMARVAVPCSPVIRPVPIITIRNRIPPA